MVTRHGISVPAVAVAAGGAAAVWAAMRGVSVASGLRALLAGHTLPPGEDLSVDVDATQFGAGALGSLAGAATGTGGSVAAAASRYLGAGHVYRWGGGGPGGWDCSGFVNYVVGHDLGLAIPGYGGGAFTGSGHGPVTSQWAVWSGCTGVTRDQVQAGDLVVWPLRHMGVAVDNEHLVHAPGPNGTPAPVPGRIDGHRLGPVVYRRLIGRR